MHLRRERSTRAAPHRRLRLAQCVVGAFAGKRIDHAPRGRARDAPGAARTQAAPATEPAAQARCQPGADLPQRRAQAPRHPASSETTTEKTAALIPAVPRTGSVLWPAAQRAGGVHQAPGGAHVAHEPERVPGVPGLDDVHRAELEILRAGETPIGRCNYHRGLSSSMVRVRAADISQAVEGIRVGQSGTLCSPCASQAGETDPPGRPLQEIPDLPDRRARGPRVWSDQQHTRRCSDGSRPSMLLLRSVRALDATATYRGQRAARLDRSPRRYAAARQPQPR